MKTAWLTKIPDCDIHKYTKNTTGVPALYDGPTKVGHHGYMCQECFDEVGYPESTINYKLEVASDVDV